MASVPLKEDIITSFAYRLGVYHPGVHIQIGDGNANGDILVVQPHQKMPERDAITGALKKFGMLSDAYRATSEIVSGVDAETNRAYLRELIEIVRPLVIVACGPDVLALLRQRKVRSFQTHSGKKFRVKDLPTITFYATINPMDYGYARASQTLKDQGKSEWETLAKIYSALKEKKEKERWAC